MMLRRALAATAVSCLAALFSSLGHAQTPPSGALIENQAEATFFNASLGIQETVRSNVVTTRVNEMPALAVAQDQERRLPPDTADQLTFEVSNTGNTVVEPVVEIEQSADDSFDLRDLLIIRDVNGNGVIDPGEPTVSAGDPISLAPGLRAIFIVALRTPPGVGAGEISFADFVVRDQARNLEGRSQGRISIVTPSIGIVKATSATTADAGDDLTYRLTVTNDGEAELPPVSQIDGRTVRVDGLVRAGLLVRDPVPHQTTFLDATAPDEFILLYNVAPNDPHAYQTTRPADPEDVLAVGFFRDGPYPAGRSDTLSFDVRINATAAGTEIENRAETFRMDGTVAQEVPSNLVRTRVAGAGGRLTFTDAAFIDDVEAIPSNTETFIRIAAGLCNTTDAVDQVAIRLSSAPDGDVETVIATEDGGNSGIFRTGAIVVADQQPVVPENGVLTGARDTAVTATAECSGVTLTDTLVVNAGGFVFNGVTNDGVGGVEVILRTEAGTAIARTRTDLAGFYAFEDVEPGTYRIEIVPPAGFASVVDPRTYPGFDRDLEAVGSFGGVFTVTDAQVQFGFDIPVEPNGQRALTVTKRSDVTSARYGEIVPYEIAVTNQSDVAVQQLVLEDILPRGFAYVSGTARLDGAELSEPAGAPGPSLNFAVGQVARRETVTLTYQARVLATSGQGRRTNRAQARGVQAGTGTAVSSNTARWTIDVDERGGVFAENGIVLGKVYFDCNLNGRQDGPEEHGIPGVKIYLQSGRSVVTDQDGKYSLPDVRPLTHVFSVLESTLPPGTAVRLSRTRDALDPRSRFVPVRFGEIRQEDFPVAPCTDATREDFEARKRKFEPADGAQSRFPTDLPLRAGRTRPIASNGPGELDTTTQIVSGGVGEIESWSVDTLSGKDGAVKSVAITEDLASRVHRLSPALGFIDLADGDRLSRDRASVRIKGPARADLSLSLNGSPVPGERMGQHSVFDSGGVQAKEYVSLRLRGGANELLVEMRDPFGNVRGSRKITVFAPGVAKGVQIVTREIAAADPNRPIPVVLRVVDASGTPVLSPTEVTLETRGGHWDVRDIRDGEPGLQAYIDNGEAIFHYVPPALAGTHELIVRSTHGTARKKIRLEPDLSENVFVSIVEGAVRFGKGGKEIAPLLETDSLSPFEKTAEGVRGALFLKGRIRGDALLTLRYESDKDTEATLFRDIKPDEYYPVYGDSSERGFEAQSSERLFVKVEKGLSYVLYGDINIASPSAAVKLGPYTRKITGVQGHGDLGPVTIDVFAGEVNAERVVTEIRGQGISGPYEINLDGLVENSEIVEIVTRDRDQPDVVLRSIRLTRFTDYTLDFFSGTILFDSPIGSFDSDLNPIFIRVTYDTEVGKAFDKYWVYGGEIRYAPREGVLVGYREVHADADREAKDRRVVRSAFASADLGLFGLAEAEVAQTENHLGETGWAARVSVEKRTENTDVIASLGRTSNGYDVPGASIGEAREEASAKVRHRVTGDVAVSAEALYSRDIDPESDGETRAGGEVRVAWNVADGIEASAGARYVVTERDATQRTDGEGNAQTLEAGREEVLSAIAGVVWQPSYVPGLTLGVELEQDLLSTEHGRLHVRSHYQAGESLKLYGELEVATSDTGVFGIGSTDTNRVIAKLGGEYEWSEGLSVFSEYRMTDRTVEGAAFGDGTAGSVLDSAFAGGAVANGFKGRFEIDEWNVVRARAEHVEPTGDEGGEKRTTAIALGYTYRDAPAHRFVTTDVEWSGGSGDTRWFWGATYADQLGDVSVLVQNRFASTETSDNLRIRDRLRAGAAWRPTPHDRFTALAWYGLEIDDNDETERSEWVHAWSLGGEYRLTDDLRLRARHAGRHYSLEDDGLDSESLILLASAGLEYDLDERFFVGLDGMVFHDPEGGTSTTGLGIELGYNVSENILASVGYNFADLEEEKIRDIHQDGVFLRVRAKFGNDALDALGGAFK